MQATNTTFEERQQKGQEFLNELFVKAPALPYEPTLVPMLFAAMKEDSSISIDGILNLVAKSPTLASKVLSVANSAAYAQTEPVGSLARAISLLGFNEVRSLLVTIGAASVLNKMPLPHNFDAYALWQHQVRTAVIAKSLVSALHDPVITLMPVNIHPDEIYVAALLHDIGSILFATLYPEIWAPLNVDSNINQLSISDKEKEYWGIDHGVIGGTVLKAWGLPNELCEIVSHHHSPSESKHFFSSASLLCAADLIAHDPPRLGDIRLSDEVIKLLPPLRNHTLLTVLILEAYASSDKETIINSIM